jgi:hypothetical protein
VIKTNGTGRTILFTIDRDTYNEDNDPIIEGTHVVLVYDAADTLIAMSIEHYLFD